MKLIFKHQKFQADAAKAVVDVFAGQPLSDANYLIDRGDAQIGLHDAEFLLSMSNCQAGFISPRLWADTIRTGQSRSMKVMSSTSTLLRKQKAP